MEKAVISIIMPAYNAEKYIAEAIRSVLGQTYPHFELLVCDDGSRDNTLAIAKNFADPRITVLSNNHNLGYLKTCNKLFALCRGEYITFQDADDYADPERLIKQRHAFDEDPTLGMVGTWANIVDLTGNFIDADERKTSYEEILQMLPTASQFNGATIMIRASVYQDIGGYREFFNDYAYQDYDWAYRIAEKYKSINIPHRLYYYRQSESGNSKKISIKRSISGALVQHLAKQRRENGKDDIQSGNLKALNQFLDGLSQPYADDPARLYREYASHYMYGRLYRQAIGASVTAIRLRPMQFVNWRTLQYCIRKYLLSSIRN
ncbi:glycosyltransferase family 2 protein [Pseudochryseolinea flava]|uniref:Glycosyltransferase 2-like domain-containing protein n=1 Tax=Pseudochryseolinea flava TaxID=2059302 RepID=A0A364Y849_9BACT|nr:glycosyltransferase family A protein [Pseudochryseolinea flava]RAW02655.1 hypothetical protein DQQ10_00665 [Pseudochryseolinea flava]